MKSLAKAWEQKDVICWVDISIWLDDNIGGSLVGGGIGRNILLKSSSGNGASPLACRAVFSKLYQNHISINIYIISIQTYDKYYFMNIYIYIKNSRERDQLHKYEFTFWWIYLDFSCCCLETCIAHLFILYASWWISSTFSSINFMCVSITDLHNQIYKLEIVSAIWKRLR